MYNVINSTTSQVVYSGNFPNCLAYVNTHKTKDNHLYVLPEKENNTEKTKKNWSNHIEKN